MVGSVCQTIDIDKEECKIRRWKNAVADFELHDREEVCSLQLTQGIDAICVFRSYKGISFTSNSSSFLPKLQAR